MPDPKALVTRCSCGLPFVTRVERKPTDIGKSQSPSSSPSKAFKRLIKNGQYHPVIGSPKQKSPPKAEKRRPKVLLGGPIYFTSCLESKGPKSLRQWGPTALTKNCFRLAGQWRLLGSQCGCQSSATTLSDILQHPLHLSVRVSPKHLESYVKEFEYRFNRQTIPEMMLGELLSRFPEVDA